MNETTIEHIALGRIRPSKTNPRKHFEESDLLELTESVRAKGVLQPLLLRPDWCMGKSDGEIVGINGSHPAPEFYEIVAGERRHRAAERAALEKLPVIVRHLSDQETLEIQLIENLQRSDLNAIEEAEGYGRLLSLRDAAGAPFYSAQLISQKTGKAVRTIYGRLKLLQAPASLRAAVEKGLVGHRVGELVGRIPVPEMREKAAREILKPPYGANPLSFRDAEALVHEEYMRSLSQAPFDQKDETLVPTLIDPETGERTGGGACTDCPMKTGNSPELFSEMKRTDICTNPKCYAAKSDANFARLEANAKAEGKRLLSAKEAKEVFQSDGDLWFDSPYEILSRQPDRAEVSAAIAKIPSWKKLLENVEAKPPIIVARDPRGRVVELVDRKLAIEAVNLAAKQKGETSIFASSSRTALGLASASLDADRFKAGQKRLRTLAKQRLAVALAAMTELISAIDAKGATVKGFWDALIETSITHASHDGCWLICKRLGLDPKAKNAHTKKIGVEGAALEYGLTLPDERFKLGFLVELLISQATKFSTATYGGGLKSTEAFSRFAKLYKVDVDAIERRVREEAKEKKARAKKPAKAPKRGGPEKGQSDIKAPPIGAIEHKWDKSSGKLVGAAGNEDKEFVCQRCGAIGTQMGSSWPPVLDQEFLEQPCLPPNEKRTRRKPSLATRKKLSEAVREARAKMKKGGVK